MKRLSYAQLHPPLQRRAWRPRIAAYRKRVGLTQRELAALLRVRPETLCRIERGQQYLTEPMQDRITRLLGVTSEEINDCFGFPALPAAEIAAIDVEGAGRARSDRAGRTRLTMVTEAGTDRVSGVPGNPRQ